LGVATKRWLGDDHGAEDEDTDKPVGLNDNVVDEVDDMVDDGGWESCSIDKQDKAGNDANDSSPSTHSANRFNSCPSARPKSASPEHDHSAVTSTFLPSLAMDFIKGDSYSYFEESESETAETGRKNRRGQRAWQA